MNQTNLAHWLRRAIEILVVLAKAGILFTALFFGLAIIISIAGGKIGPIHAIIEWRLILPAILGALLISGGTIYIGKRLCLIFTSLEAGDPFIDENAHRLKQIGICLGALELGRYLIKLFTLLVLQIFGQPENGELRMNFDPSIIAWGAVLILLILAQVFKEGARLRKNDQLTI